MPKYTWGFGVPGYGYFQPCHVRKARLEGSSGVESLSARILKAKYFPTSSPFFASTRSGSQFWRALGLVRDEFRSLVKFVVGDDKSRVVNCSWLHAGLEVLKQGLVGRIGDGENNACLESKQGIWTTPLFFSRD